MGYDDELAMEQNQLYLIKQLEKKIESFKRVLNEPDKYNAGLASQEQIDEVSKRLDGQGYLIKNMASRIEKLEKMVESLENDLKEV
tara:strand:- start:123 stop:380 length:258 start_codon:yes stop_codon:yes gene_type:complete